RTVVILPEVAGRVEEVYVRPFQDVRAGDPLFRLEGSKQRAALETARKRIAEIDAAIVVAKSELVTVDAQIKQVETAFLQAKDDLATQLDLQRRSPGTVARKEVDRLQNIATGKESEL